MFENVVKLTGKENRLKLALIGAAMVVGAFLEMYSISFVSAACAAILSGKGPMGSLGINHVYVTVFALILLYIFKLVFQLFQCMIQKKFVCSIQYRLSVSIYKRMLYMPYGELAGIGSPELTRLAELDTKRAAEYVDAFLGLMTETITFAAVCMILTYINLGMTLAVAAAAAVSLALIRKCIRPVVYKAGAKRQRAESERIKWLNQGICGIKNVKIWKAEDSFLSSYQNAALESTKNETLPKMLDDSCTICVESIMVVFLLLYILYLNMSGKNVSDYIPSLSALAAAAMRFLPNVKRISRNQILLSNKKKPAETVAMVLGCIPEYGHPAHGNASLHDGIELQDVSFAYEGRPEPVIRGVSMKIPAGSAVGLVGASGNGKSTLADILIGILDPMEGKVMVDGKDIKECRESFLDLAAYVPQSTFLLNDTIRNNVAFCRQVDDRAIWDALDKASLGDFVRNLPSGLDTAVGENGILMSGGERQRLGIARALYKGAELIVFDEATSGLDGKTESEIIGSIRALKGKKTIVVISHRDSTVSVCDTVYSVQEGGLQQVMAKNPSD